MKQPKTKFGMKRVFICAPNDEILGKKLVDSVLAAGHAPMHPVFLAGLRDELTPVRRHRALTWLGVCDEIWIFSEGDEGCTSEMTEYINRARMFFLPIVPTYMPPQWKVLHSEYMGRINQNVAPAFGGLDLGGRN